MALIEKLRQLLLPILRYENVELVDLQVKGKVGNQTIKVFVDTAAGINLDQCKKVSQKFSDQIDFEDLIVGNYRLEVSSPGLDRPLACAGDFRRNLFKEADIRYENGVEERSVSGEIVDVSDEMVQIKNKGEVKIIPIANITFGRIKLPW